MTKIGGLIRCTISLLIVVFLTTYSSKVIAQQDNKQVNSVLNTFSTKNAENVYLNADGHVRVLRWTRSYIRLYVNIEIFHDYRGLLDRMVEDGRYRVNSSRSKKTLELEVTSLQHPIYYNDYPVNEYVWYTLYVPKKLEVKSNGKLEEIESDPLQLQRLY